MLFVVAIWITSAINFALLTKEGEFWAFCGGEHRPVLRFGGLGAKSTRAWSTYTRARISRRQKLRESEGGGEERKGEEVGGKKVRWPYFFRTCVEKTQLCAQLPFPLLHRFSKKNGSIFQNLFLFFEISVHIILTLVNCNSGLAVY